MRFHASKKSVREPQVHLFENGSHEIAYPRLEKKMLHKICITRKWSKKQMMFKDRNKNYRGVCASAKIQPCFQLCSNSLQQRCGADEQPTTGRWLLREASGIRRLVISFQSLLKNPKRRNQQV